MEPENPSPEGSGLVEEQLRQKNVDLATPISKLPDMENAPYLFVVKLYLEKFPPKEKTRIEILEEEHPGFTQSLKEITVKLRHDWKKIAKKIENLFNFYGSPCFFRILYKEISQNKPSSQKIRFTKEEDNLLADLIKKHGTAWEEMISFFKKRDANALKNRYYYLLKKDPSLSF